MPDKLKREARLQLAIGVVLLAMVAGSTALFVWSDAQDLPHIWHCACEHGDH